MYGFERIRIRRRQNFTRFAGCPPAGLVFYNLTKFDLNNRLNNKG